MTDEAGAWKGHRFAAGALRVLIAVLPLAVSLAAVAVASRLVPAPTSSLALFVLWWLGLAGAGMLVVVGMDVLARKALPLAALLKLSLIFPDHAPSRFRTALRSSSTRRLRAVVEAATEGRTGDTPAEAAEQLLTLVAALNAHDRLTRGHSERVRAYTRMIAEELDLPPGDVALLHWAGLLHDVGKLEVPYEILNKPDRPTAEEWEILKRHPEIGMRLIEPLRSWLGSWADAVGQHHERWDGNGYPNGRAGTDIAFAARIVSVADVFDVITSARSYKKSQGAIEARAEITRCAGTQFDPKVVRAFLNISIGRLRLAMGPLSWLAHVPSMGGASLTPAVGSALSALAVGVGALVGGVVAHDPSPARDVTTTRVAAVAKSVAFADVGAETDEDVPVVVRLAELDGVYGVADVHIEPDARSGGTARMIGGHRARVVPPRDFSGSMVFRFGACVGSDCATAALRVVVRPVNDPPIAADDDVSTAEDSSVSISPLANDRDVDGAVSLWTGSPSSGVVHQDGKRLRFDPAPDFVGVVTIPYRAGDGSTSSPAVIRVRVGAVDDAPSFVAGPGVSVDEDSGPHTIAGWATGISPGPADEAGQSVSFITATDAPALFADAPHLASDGTLTFSAAANANGTATLTINANDSGGTDTSAPQTATVTIDAVNDAPSFIAGPVVTVDEDSGPHTIVGWATGISPGPADEAGQAVAFTASAASSLFAVPPAVAPDGTLTFTPAASAHGTATVTMHATDDGGAAHGGTDTSSAHTAAITIGAVNDAPSFVAGPTVSVDEDSGPHTIAGWATGISPGPADEAGQSVSFITATDAPALFAAAPHIASDGRLTFTPAPNANGTATLTLRVIDDGGTAHGGTDTSSAQTATITIDAVNDAPSFTAGPAVTVDEDDGPQTIAGWATAISPGPADEAGQTVAFTTSTSDPNLFAVPPVVAPDGTLTFTPGPDANGTTTLTIQATDDGGTAHGGTDTSSAHTATITIDAVNDGPSFTAGPAVTVDEDSGPQTIAGWATGISPGPADEAGQTVAFTTTNSDPSLFAVPPAVAPDGTLTFTSAPNENGIATISLRVTDGGGTAHGGTDTSAPQTATITIDAVNDAPSFTAGPAVTVDEDSGPHTIAGWATGISPGPADEAGQTVAFTTSSTDPSLFAVPPTVAPDGTLTFTPTPDANGTATLTVQVADDGGAAHGGTDTSAPQTATITIGPVNDAPTFAAGPAVTVDEDTGAFTAPTWASAISPGPADEAGQTVAFTVTNSDSSLFAVPPAVAPDGTLTFTPAPDANGTATLAIRASDDGGTARGGTDTSAPQSSTITINAVNDPPTAGADTATITEDSAGVTIDALANDTDPDGDTVQVVALDTSGIVGTASDNGNGTITYVPVADFNGTEVVPYQIGDGHGGNATATLTIVVQPVPDAPTANPDSYATPEGTTLTVAAPGITSNDYDVDGDPLTVSITPITAPTDGVLTLSTDGSTIYAPNPGFRGSDTFTYRVNDGTGRSALGTVSITVDSGATTSTLYFGASGASATNYDLTAAPPAAATPVPDIDGDSKPGLTIKKGSGAAAQSDARRYHDWTYRPATPLALDGPIQVDLWSSLRDNHTSNAGHPSAYLYDCDAGGVGCTLLGSGSVRVDPWNGGLAWAYHAVTLGAVAHTIPAGHELTLRVVEQNEDLWIATTGAYPSGLSVTLGNAAPVATDDTFTTLEDSVGTSFDVAANDTDVNLSPTSVSIVSPPAIASALAQPDGTVAYTPPANWSGTDTFVYRVCDTSGLCSNATATVTVTPVNDAPAFTPGTAITVAEDAGSHVAAGWATGISAGPPDEVTQSVVFTVTNDNPSLFVSAPNVAADGTLSYTPAPNAFGSATVSVRAVDNGGTTGGGNDTSPTAVITITIAPINDAPSFTSGPNITVISLGGAQSFPAWATNIVAGPSNESVQSVSFAVSVANASLFSVAPAIAPDGTLTFTPTGIPGTSTVSVSLADDGGTAGGGIDTSATVTFTIVVI